MSKPKKPAKVLLFTAVLASKDVDVQDILEVLSRKIGSISYCSRLMNFVWSDYYEQEMGAGLKRVFVLYSRPIEREALVKYKKLCDKLEQRYLVNGKRSINVDPGIMTMENIVLATNKAFFHRIYIKDGVYGELTLFYKRGSYNPIEYWTFPEYRSTPVIDFFNSAREFMPVLR